MPNAATTDISKTGAALGFLVLRLTTGFGAGLPCRACIVPDADCAVSGVAIRIIFL
jgi:hypothetical protein